MSSPRFFEYLLLNKPKGYVSTVSDPEGRPSGRWAVVDAGGPAPTGEKGALATSDRKVDLKDRKTIEFLSGLRSDERNRVAVIADDGEKFGAWPNTYEHVLAAARIKAGYPISYADAFAVASAQREKATLVTGDPELRAVEHLVPILWI